MSDPFSRLFDTRGFPPRWTCGDWSSIHGWVHIVADVAVFGAYTAIPLVLAFFLLRRRPNVAFPRVGWLFVAFIFACGTTHLIEATIFWRPWYRLSALAKVLTAAVSWCTVGALFRVAPRAMLLRSPAELENEVGERTAELSATQQRLEAEVVERRRAEDAAGAASQAKSQFLARVSHELRTPLAAVLGHADLLARKLADPSQLEHLGIVRRNGEHLLELLDEILDVARVEAGRLEIERTRFSVVELVADVASLMRVRASERGLALDLEWDGPLPVTVESDPARVRQILINLIGNAIKYTDEGSVRLATSLRSIEGTPRLRFVVSDTGVGIAGDELARVFEPFEQSVLGRDGLGLGLAISRRLARLLGGDVTVESHEGRGSAFEVLLDPGPLEGIELLEVERHPRAADALREEELPRLAARVLVVDDAQDVRDFASAFLRAAGADVEEVGSGAEALAAVDRGAREGRPFDAVLMDVQLPHMDGLEATRRLRRAGFRGAVVAFTARAMRGDRERFLAAGCDAYLAKPVRGRALVETLAKLLERRSEPAPERGAAPGAGNGLRILLVEDHEDLRKAFRLMLSGSGHDVREASSGASALDAAAAFHPQIVLLDLGLPDMDGTEVCARLRDLTDLAPLRIIALTGREPASRVARSGFDAYLFKPVQPAELLAALRAADGA